MGRVWVGYYGTLKSLITVKSVDFDGRDRILWPGPADCCIATSELKELKIFDVLTGSVYP